MKIFIEDVKTIQEIQDEFCKAFPYLKILFLSRNSVPNKSPGGKFLNKALTIGECRVIRDIESFTIKPQMTVTQLERIFWNNYGLSVQIIRKTGSAWIETSVTNVWSLEMQNGEGAKLSVGQ